MASQRKQTIRERAYAIWEQEGRPDGKDLDHWLRAEAETAIFSRMYERVKHRVSLIVKPIITQPIAIIALIVSVGNLIAYVYLNFLWHPESLKVYFHFIDPKQVGTSTLDLSYIFTDSGKQSYLIDSIFIYEFWKKAPRPVTGTISEQLNMCTQSIVSAKSTVEAFLPMQYEKVVHYTLKDGGEAAAFHPVKIYNDGIEVKFPSTLVEAGKTKSVLATFTTDPLDKQKYDTVVICPTIRFFDGDGQPVVAMCKGWASTIIPESEMGHVGQYFQGPGGPVTLLPSPSSCSIEPDF